MDKLEYILMRARKGDFGTAKNPDRSHAKLWHFWNSYFGMTNESTPKKGDQYYEYVVAGKRFNHYVKGYKNV